jgi:demethylmenaquinone methyltransferase/2-methoxy-6-polyprenyl-1,4-benzoquinol methylase
MTISSSSTASSSAAEAAKNSGRGPEAHWFGDRAIDPETKASLVRGVFDSVASRYDLMNDLMSGGIHRLWKDALIAMIAPRPTMRLLDVAGGTGDIALRFLDQGGGAVTVCDLTESMIRVGRDRAIDRGRLEHTENPPPWQDQTDKGRITWVTGDAERLPIADMSVDVYTIAFGLRNVTGIDNALAEARRVLKPGGRFFCLEFSRVVIPGFQELYDRYSYSVLPKLGRLVAGDEDSYRYLVESIRKFPDQESLTKRIAAVGLSRPRYRNLTGGIAAIHSAWRL